jgi:hypothetical protein
MTAMHISGPHIVYGDLPGSAGNNPEAGPSGDYQGSFLVDPRYQYQPGMTGIGHIKGFLGSTGLCVLDAAPQAKSATLLYSGQPAVPAGGSLAVALPTSNSGLSLAVGVPLVPFGQPMRVANQQTVVCLDPGHTKCTTSASSKAITIPSGGDGRLIRVGQFVGVPGAGSSGAFFSSQVLARSIGADGTGTITVADQPATAVTAGPLMLMDLTGASVVPWHYAGAGAMFDPYSAVARRLEYVSTNAGDTTYTATAVGYDFHMQPLSETVTFNGTTVVTGRKAFRYLSSLTIGKTGGGTPAGTLRVGTSDYFGFGLKVENWEAVRAFWNSSSLTGSTVTGGGFTAADATTANTTSTTDVRGSYGVGTAAAADGSRRLTAFVSPPARQLLAATWADPTPLFGVAQA